MILCPFWPTRFFCWFNILSAFGVFVTVKASLTNPRAGVFLDPGLTTRAGVELGFGDEWFTGVAHSVNLDPK